MPAWISFNPTGSSPPTGGWTTVKMTIDPSKGTGGSILLGFIGRDPSVNGGAWHLLYLSTWTWYDQNGTQFGSFNEVTGTFTDGYGSFFFSTDSFPGSSNNTSLDLGPSFPRSGCEGMCGMPINLTNGNTWARADEYELPGLGGGISLKRTWNSQWANSYPFIEAGMFGDSWQSSYEKRIQLLSGGVELRYWRGDGSAWLFTSSKTGWTLVSPPDERATLTSKSGSQSRSAMGPERHTIRMDTSQHCSIEMEIKRRLHTTAQSD